MITKHPATERLRKLRPIFFQFGLLVSLGLTLAAFKWTTYMDTVEVKIEKGKTDKTYEITAINIIDEFQKKQETSKKIEVPKPDPDKMNLVDDKKEIEEKKQEDDSYQKYLDGLLNGKPKNPNAGPQIFENDDIVRDNVEKMPSFPGGDEARVKFIKKHIRFPYDLQYEPKTITVYTSAVIEKDGRLTNIQVVKDGGYPSAGEAAKKVVEQMPKWNPGYQGIWPVRVKIVIPIKFRID